MQIYLNFFFWRVTSSWTYSTFICRLPVYRVYLSLSFYHADFLCIVFLLFFFSFSENLFCLIEIFISCFKEITSVSSISFSIFFFLSCRRSLYLEFILCVKEVTGVSSISFSIFLTCRLSLYLFSHIFLIVLLELVLFDLKINFMCQRNYRCIEYLSLSFYHAAFLCIFFSYTFLIVL